MNYHSPGDRGRKSQPLLSFGTRALVLVEVPWCRAQLLHSFTSFAIAGLSFAPSFRHSASLSQQLCVLPALLDRTASSAKLDPASYHLRRFRGWIQGFLSLAKICTAYRWK